MNEHTCTDRCSWRATPDSLTALGFPVKLVEKGCFGTPVTVREGKEFHLARHDAWAAKALDCCHRRPLPEADGAEPEWLKRFFADRVAVA